MLLNLLEFWAVVRGSCKVWHSQVCCPQLNILTTQLFNFQLQNFWKNCYRPLAISSQSIGAGEQPSQESNVYSVNPFFFRALLPFPSLFHFPRQQKIICVWVCAATLHKRSVKQLIRAAGDSECFHVTCRASSHWKNDSAAVGFEQTLSRNTRRRREGERIRYILKALVWSLWWIQSSPVSEYSYR